MRETDKKEGIITMANTVVQPEILKKIFNQNRKVRDAFSAQYEAYKLTEIFAYIDRRLASIGILG